MTEQVERLIERLNFGNACQAPEANGSRCGQCQCCQRAQAATMIERLSAEKAALKEGNLLIREQQKEDYDRAERAESQLAEARGALEPFANCCEHITDDEDDEEWAKFRLLIKDYRRAKAALALPAEQGEE